MIPFLQHNPTKLWFGKNQIEQLANEVQAYHRILIVYGGGSIKKNAR